ncbi:MAG: choice-of-anchor Q domain-containing protein [Planctomycetota bacterium]
MLRRAQRRSRRAAVSRSAATRRRSPRRPARLGCETLEDRRLLAAFTVTSLEDAGAGTLRAAIDWANATPGADEIDFAPSLFQHGPGDPTPGVILLDSALPTVTDDLTITGPGAELLTLDGQRQEHDPDGSIDWHGILGIDESVISINAMSFENSGSGSAIYAYDSTLSVSESAFTGNGRYGDAALEDERAASVAGAIAAYSGTLVVTASTFHENWGSAISTYGNATILDSEFTANTAGGLPPWISGYESAGGAVSSAGHSLIIERTLLSDNEADLGGAVFFSGGTLEFRNSAAIGNRADRLGGAIYSIGHTTHIVGSTLSQNSARDGAGVYDHSADLLIEGVTAAKNSGTDPWSDGSAVRIFRDSDFIQIAIRNSVVAGNETTAGDLRYTTPYILEGVVQTSNNLIGYIREPSYTWPNIPLASDGVDGNRVGAEYAPLGPGLGPLAYNGGPTPTHAPLPGSRVIDAGGVYDDQPATDQRGVPRVAHGGWDNRPDIGSFEYQAAPDGLPGDLNADGRFDAADYTVWRDSHGQSVVPLSAGDSDGDGAVTEDDLRPWRSNFGHAYYAGRELVVNDLGDEDDGDVSNGVTTLREAVNFVNREGVFDTITFDPALSGGVIEMGQPTGETGFGAPFYGSGLALEREVTIDASMVPGGVTIDGNGNAGFFVLYAKEALYAPIEQGLTLNGLTLTRGGRDFGRGLPFGSVSPVRSYLHGEVKLIDTHVVDSTHDQFAVVYAEGPVTLIDSSITNSDPDAEGNGAIVADGDVTLIRSEVRDIPVQPTWAGPFTENDAAVVATARDHTGLHYRNGVARRVTLIDSEVSGTRGGGALYASGEVRLERSRIEDNAGTGVVAVGDPSRSLAPHTPPGVTPGAATLVDSVVAGNAGTGVIADTSVTLTRSRIENHTAATASDGSYFGEGGGIVTDGVVRAADSVIAGNAARQGGGIYASGRSEWLRENPLPPGRAVVELVGTAVNGNTADDFAAIYAADSIRITGGSSVSGNTLSGLSHSYYAPATIFVESVSASSVRTDGVYIADTVMTSNAAPEDEWAWVVTAELYGRVTALGQPAGTTLERVTVSDNQMNGVQATTLVDSTVSRNDGTGVFLAERIERSLINANRGGGVGTGWSGQVAIIDSTIRGNTRDLYSSSVAVASGVSGHTNGHQTHVRLERSRVVDNVGFVTGGSRHSAGQTAGGVAATDVVAIDSTIAGNTVETVGEFEVHPDSRFAGGIVATQAVRLYGSTVSGNAADGPAGAAGGVSAPTVELRQSTVSGNHARGDAASGGGVRADTLVAVHSTVAANRSDGDGGGAAVAVALDLEGTILAGNAAPAGPDLAFDPVADPEALAATIDRVVNHTLIGDSAGFAHDASMGVGNLLDVDPLLGPLADNGGPTLTHAPLPGSPAIDAGDPTRAAVEWTYQIGRHDPESTIPGTDDQRGAGFPRVVDAGSGAALIDLGAVESPGVVTGDVAAAAWARAATPSAAAGDADSVAAPAGAPADRDAALLLLLGEEPLGKPKGGGGDGFELGAEDEPEAEADAADAALGVF